MYVFNLSCARMKLFLTTKPYGLGYPVPRRTDRSVRVRCALCYSRYVVFIFILNFVLNYLKILKVLLFVFSLICNLPWSSYLIERSGNGEKFFFLKFGPDLKHKYWETSKGH